MILSVKILVYFKKKNNKMTKQMNLSSCWTRKEIFSQSVLLIKNNMTLNYLRLFQPNKLKQNVQVFLVFILFRTEKLFFCFIFVSTQFYKLLMENRPPAMLYETT